MTDPIRVAVVQQPAVFFDLAGAVQRAAMHVEAASAQGAHLVAFPEAWLGGYPAWAFGAAGWEETRAQRWYAELVNNAAVVGGSLDDDDLGPVRAAAASSNVGVVLGLNERAGPRSGTVFNSQATIGPDGTLLNLHRKLTPTLTEKNVWAPGDAAGLRACDIGGTATGGLICWEHWNPLARQALHDQHEQVHVGAWPDAPDVHELATRAYAFEGRCFAILAASYATVDDIPFELVDAFRVGLGTEVDSEEPILLDGGSGVAGPDATWLLAPARGEPGIFLADLDLNRVAEHQLAMDLGGHYQRPDVFRLEVDTYRHPGTTYFTETGPADRN